MSDLSERPQQASVTTRQLRSKSYTPDPDAPPLQAQWFHSVDAPIVDPIELRRSGTQYSLTPVSTPSPAAQPADRPGSAASTSSATASKKQPRAAPKNWVAFSMRDSSAIEHAYQADVRDAKVPVNEDHLFEVDVQRRTIEPIYWEGPTYRVRRATWFMQGDGSKWVPCEENLAEQIETGYHKYKPYLTIDAPPTQITAAATPAGAASTSAPASDTAPAESKPEPTAQEASKLKTALEQPMDKQWNLLGSYLEQYVVYTGADTAWLLYDTTGSKIAQSIITKLTNAQNLGGTRLLRGYTQVLKLEDKKATKESASAPAPPAPATAAASVSASAAPAPAPSTPTSSTTSSSTGRSALGDSDDEDEKKMTAQLKEDYENEASEGAIRNINHLVFAIHGIGQKFSERLGFNFVHDCNTLRKTMKACHHVVTDEPNGIQVLPILWRKNITFGMASNESEADMGMHMDDDGCPTLDEITLDGIPMYRMLVSDVFLDIPLYMTQKYRDQMTIIIIKEINRVYKLFLDRHPDFVKNGGKVSILGHSLGSLLALDVLSNQPFSAKEAATLKETDQALLQAVEQKKTPPLMFPVDNFFAVGSPLGIILLLRGFKIASRQVLNKDASAAFDWEKSSASLMDQHHISYYYPAVKHFYNIFHRSDPVAYRVEPLIARHFSAKEKPVLIPYIKGGLKGVLDASLNVGSGIAKSAGAMFDTLRVSWTNSFIRNFKFAKAAEEDAAAAAEAHGKPAAMEMRSISPDVKDHGARKLAMLNPRQGRVDFCLQEGILENAYFSALSVHMNYWQDLDVAAMLIREIYTHKLDESKPS